MGTLKIFLGYACNFNCTYCLQRIGNYKPNMRLTDEQVHKIVDVAISRSLFDISYWGGEPLLYFDTISLIQEEFIRRGVKVATRLSTNGSLLTSKIVKALNSWNTYVVLSEHIEQGDINWNDAVKLNRFSVSFLYRHGHTDPFDFFTRLKSVERTYGRLLVPYTHWIRATSDTSSDDYFTEDDLEIHSHMLWLVTRLALSGDRYCTLSLEPHVNELHKHSSTPLCGNNGDLVIDLDGDVFNCHHDVKKIKSIGNAFELKFAPNTAPNRFIDTSVCRKCSILTWCRGNCFRSNTHDIDCKLAKVKHRILTKYDQERTK